MGVEVPERLAWAFSSLSVVMVEVEVDLEKVLVRGPRWVSLSSAERVVSQPWAQRYTHGRRGTGSVALGSPREGTPSMARDDVVALGETHSWSASRTWRTSEATMMGDEGEGNVARG